MTPALRIRQVSLIQFRNYASSIFNFEARVTSITGPNGSGKTNLLDAVYYLCFTKSYFTNLQQNSVQNGTDGFRVSGIFGCNDTDDLISCKWKAAKKEVFRNEVLYEKMTDHIGRYSSVMIAPDDTELINAGSEHRRRWIDSILGQTDRTYLEKLMLYQRVLLQRNAWLKLQAAKYSSDYAELDFYNMQLVQAGEYIYQQRKLFLTDFLPFINEFYQNISNGREAVSLVYQTDLHEQRLMELLQGHLEHDIRMQRTLKGIHKDDWTFLLNVKSIRQFGSQGQKKSFLFALKLGQYAYLSQKLGHLPILLLDDIFEKLDQQRMESLLSIISDHRFGQVILTDTHEDRIKATFGKGAEVGFVRLG